MKTLFTYLSLSLFLFSCEPKTTKITRQPNLSNERYAHVFKPLDGKWKGKFYVYSDKRGQLKGNAHPKNIDAQTLEKLPLKTELIVDVEQIYHSVSPYLQKVTIKDSYVENGKVRIVESSGVNKVENGILWCIVDKPDEQVVHKGSVPKENTIIWERNMRRPTKIEFFHETVADSIYTIIGYGYYGKDDPKKSPKTWFFSEYKRIE